MATTPLVPRSEYWSATCHPGCDQSEGRLEERGVHNADRFRVPGGVTIVRGGKPSGRIVATPLAGGIHLAEAAEGSLTMPGVPSDRQDDEEDAGHRIN